MNITIEMYDKLEAERDRFSELWRATGKDKDALAVAWADATEKLEGCRSGRDATLAHIRKLVAALSEIVVRYENEDPMMPIECAQHCRNALGFAAQRDSK
jgi:hypothetical protein